MEIHRAPFVIVAQARSGSTMLRRALHSHDAICCHGELFMKKKVQGHSIYVPGLHWTEKPDALLARREGDFTDFVQCLMFPPRAELSAIGFKVLDEQFFFPSNEVRLTNLIASHPHMTLIFLYRQTALERYVSRLNRRGKFDSSRTQTLSADDFRTFEHDSIDRMSRIYKLFPSHRKIVVSYESLAAHIEPTISFLYGVLGAQLAPVTIEETKSAPKDLPTLIENYEELSSLPMPVFDHDTDDDPMSALAALDPLPSSEQLRKAYELGRSFVI